MSTPWIRVPLVSVALMLALSAYSSSAELPPGAHDGSAVTGHIHNLALDGEMVVMGTHYGLWGQEPGSAPTQISAEPFDVMGLAKSGDTWFASGHPGPGMEGPADLGLLASVDSGSTWRSVSLSGEVDFHRLTASGNVVLGQSAPDKKLLRSGDGGLTWQDLGAPPVFDISINPANADEVIATSEQGLLKSTDGGVSFLPLPNAPRLMLVSWSAGSITGVDPEGQFHRSLDAASTWQALGSVSAEPIAIAASGERVVVLAGDTIWQSDGDGVNFAARIANLGGH
jgi:hypothetical protein